MTARMPVTRSSLRALSLDRVMSRSSVGLPLNRRAWRESSVSSTTSPAMVICRTVPFRTPPDNIMAARIATATKSMAPTARRQPFPPLVIAHASVVSLPSSRTSIDPYLIKSPGLPAVPELDRRTVRQLTARGAALFDAARFFEAHEVFEDLWRASTGDHRRLYQGVVQVCAGLVKHQRGQPGPAVTLLRRGLEKLDRAPAESGIDAAALAAAVRDLL